MKRFVLHHTAVLLAPLASDAAAITKVAPYFTDHAVLPSERAVPVWGLADPGQKIQVSFANHHLSTTTGADGKWSVDLPALTAGTRGELRIEGDTAIVLHDVVAGEVWFCSGQSNMELTVEKYRDAATEIKNAAFPDIRHFKVTLRSSPGPLDAFAIAGPIWQPASPENVGSFTAAGYFFAREIRKRLNVPVGLINATWGGTPIHPWMTPEEIQSWEHYGQMMENKRKEIENWPRRKAENEASIREWQEQVKKAEAERRPAPVKPWFPGPPDAGQYMPSQLYHAMVLPFTRIPVCGVLWYQGESNAGGGEGGATRYTELQNRLIRGWRKDWRNESMPFLFVQLAGFRQPADASGLSWAFFREGQQATLAVHHTAMAVAADIGEADDVHPKNKQELGRRLALLALTDVYQKPGILSRGPEPERIEPGEQSIRITFRHAQGGLKTADGKTPAGFTVAGEDKIFHPADAKIEGDTIIVSSPSVPHPKFVRHAFANFPELNLINEAGLPAAPFRSDRPVKP